MIGVALACLVVALGVFLVSMRMLSRERREHARAERAWEAERGRLIEQMCSLADPKLFPPPPRAPEPTPPPSREPDPDEDLAVW